MSKYSAEKYAESARKHGITPGPYYAHKNSTTGMDSLRPEGFQITTSPDPQRAMYVLETVPYGSDSEEAQAIAHARLPDLLIERDEKDAEIEKYRHALGAVAFLRNWYDPIEDAEQDIACQCPKCGVPWTHREVGVMLGQLSGACQCGGWAFDVSETLEGGAA